ncbi:GNAT family N-acetyltransferase [Actinokineospora bangkokensis]|uniref:GNAT family N-acetyltransferase n=1 Tax=Actinokineospora bangkokensis TaxID=1193682 RepID=UPI000AE87B90|nr:GNAT family N-acetyltransferase [Actinokineospora bangkokensis]
MLTFRPATPADVPFLVPLVESAYRGTGADAGWTTESHLIGGQRTDEAAVLEAITTSTVLIGLRDAEPVACCQVAVEDGAGYFGLFAVSPKLQGEGLGSVVLAEAERYAAQELGMPEMRMKVVSAREDLIAWYVRRGYARTGRTSPFPYGDERFGIPRVPDLVFETLVKPLPSGAS